MLYELHKAEDTIRANGGLNPCFVGKCSTSWAVESKEEASEGLNPCFVGKCSTSDGYHYEIKVLEQS